MHCKSVKRLAIACMLSAFTLSACTTAPQEKRLDPVVFKEQDRAIELSKDDRVRKLLRAYQRQHPKAIDAMQKVAGYLRYGAFSVDQFGVIYREREGSVKTPVNMPLLVLQLEKIYDLQDRKTIPIYPIKP